MRDDVRGAHSVWLYPSKDTPPEEKEIAEYSGVHFTEVSRTIKKAERNYKM